LQFGDHSILQFINAANRGCIGESRFDGLNRGYFDVMGRIKIGFAGAKPMIILPAAIRALALA